MIADFARTAGKQIEKFTDHNRPLLKRRRFVQAYSVGIYFVFLRNYTTCSQSRYSLWWKWNPVGANIPNTRYSLCVQVVRWCIPHKKVRRKLWRIDLEMIGNLALQIAPQRARTHVVPDSIAWLIFRCDGL